MLVLLKKEGKTAMILGTSHQPELFMMIKISLETSGYFSNCGVLKCPWSDNYKF